MRQHPTIGKALGGIAEGIDEARIPRPPVPDLADELLSRDLEAAFQAGEAVVSILRRGPSSQRGGSGYSGELSEPSDSTFQSCALPSSACPWRHLTGLLR